MVTRTRLDVTLYVHCLSWLLLYCRCHDIRLISSQYRVSVRLGVMETGGDSIQNEEEYIIVER